MNECLQRIYEIQREEQGLPPPKKQTNPDGIECYSVEKFNIQLQLHTTYLNILLFAIFKNVCNHLGFVNCVIITKLSLVV